VSVPSIPHRPVLLVVLASLIYLEATALAAISVVLIIDIASQHPDSYLSAIGLIALAILATGWLAVIATHALQGRPWIRGGVVTWQVLQGIIGITAISGGSAVGWPLVASAAVVLIVLFAPPVVKATRRLPREE